jgi:hypothetical protein
VGDPARRHPLILLPSCLEVDLGSAASGTRRWPLPAFVSSGRALDGGLALLAILVG